LHNFKLDAQTWNRRANGMGECRFLWGLHSISGTVSEIQRRQQTADDAGNQTETDAHVFSNQLVAQENTKIPEVYLGSRELAKWSWSWKLPGGWGQFLVNSPTSAVKSVPINFFLQIGFGSGFASR